MKAAKLAKEQDTPIEGIIVNKIRNPKHEFDLKKIEETSEIPVLARIRDHKKMAEALSKRTPITVLDRRNIVSKEIENFSSAICGTPEELSLLQKILPLNGILGKEKVNRVLLREKFYEDDYKI